MASTRYLPISDGIEHNNAPNSPVTPADNAYSNSINSSEPLHTIELNDPTVITPPSGPIIENNARASLPDVTTTGLQLPQYQGNDSELHLRSEPVRLPLPEGRFKYSFSPEHHPSAESLSLLSNETLAFRQDTSRVYGRKIQLWRIWRLAAAEWLVTASLCAMYGIVLWHFSRQKKMSSRQLTQLTVVFTVLTFLLGVNLTASMRSYAKLLRWHLLSLTYLPLELFDLVLRCESLINVMKLGWKASALHRRKVRWTIQAMSTLWLTANVALTLFVGMIGLTYTIDPSNGYVNTMSGTVSITDFSSLQTGGTSADLSKIRDWAVKAYGQQCFNDDSDECYSWLDGQSAFWLAARNPKDYDIGASRSDMRIYVHTNCNQYDVIRGGNGTSTTITIKKGDEELNKTVAHNKLSVPDAHGIAALARLCDDCTDRTTRVNIFVAGEGVDPAAKFYECNNTVKYVQEYLWNNKTNNKIKASSEYQFNDFTARMLAGAIAWDGFDYDPDLWQMQTYRDSSEVTRNMYSTYDVDVPSATNISDFISAFTTGMMHTMDLPYDGLGVYKQAPGQVPLRAQQLHVQWRNALLLLVGIPGLQLAACIVVFAVANRAIIKDDSPLSMAKLYLRLLQRNGFGDRGCMLRGDEIVDVINRERNKPEGQGPMVRYWWSRKLEPDGRTIGHLDVFEEGDEDLHDERAPGTSTPDLTRNRKTEPTATSFWPVRYDGMGGTQCVSRNMTLPALLPL